MEAPKKNNQIEVPLAHYRLRLKDMDPREVCARTGALYDRERDAFFLMLMGKKVCVRRTGDEMSFTGEGYALKGYEEILMFRFLLDGKYAAPMGSFLAYNEMPWGELYMPNFRGRCISRLARWAGRDPTEFSRSAKILGGRSAAAGDEAYDIDFMDNLTVRLIIWNADEEFSASAQILFSDNFHYAFGAEDMAVVGDIILDGLKQAQNTS